MDALRGQAMEWMYDEANGSQFVYVELGEFMTEAGIDDDAGRGLVADLASRGLVKDESTFGGPGALLRPAGVRWMEERRRQRADPVLRATAARNGLLRYFYRQDLAGTHMPYTRDVLTTDDAVFLGEVLTTGEIAGAAEYLEDRGLINGSRVAELRGPVAAQITSDGRDCAEQHGGDVAGYLRDKGRGGTSITTNIGTLHNSGALAVGSTGVTQTVIANDLAAIADMVSVLLGALSELGLSTENETAVRVELVDVQRELNAASPRPGRIRAALARAAGYLGDTSNLINAGERVAKALDSLSRYLG